MGDKGSKLSDDDRLVGRRIQEARERRRRRDGSKWTQAYLAERAGVSVDLIRKLEGGRGGSLGSFRRVAAALEVDLGHLLDAPVPARTPVELLRIDGGASSAVNGSPDNGQEEEAATNRRELLKLGLATLLAQTSRATRPGQVGPDLVSRYVELRAHLIGADAEFGAMTVAYSAARQLDEIRHAVLYASGATRCSLFEIGSMFAELAGWLADDVGNLEQGAAWTDQALDWAHASGNQDVIAYVLMRKAQRAVNSGDGPLAVGLAGASVQLDGVSCRIRAASLIHQGLGHATESNETAAMAAFEQAHTLLSATPKDCGRGDLDLASFCVGPYVLAQRGVCLTRLGHYREAVSDFDAALGTWPSKYRRERGLHLSRKAVALAAAGDIEEAIDVGRDAIQVVKAVGSARAIGELHRFDRLLAASSVVSHEASAFRHELAAC